MTKADETKPSEGVPITIEVKAKMLPIPVVLTTITRRGVGVDNDNLGIENHVFLGKSLQHIHDEVSRQLAGIQADGLTVVKGLVTAILVKI